MTKKWMLAGALLFLVTISAVAQTTEAPKAEITGEYSYLRYNPTLPGLNNRNFNGGGVDLSYFFLPMVGFKAELLFYGSTNFNTTFATPVATSIGTVPAGTYIANGSMQTYQFGPIVKARYKHFEPFGQILFGIAHINGYANVEKAIAVAPGATLRAQGAQTPFAMTVGGGIDIPIRPNIAIRAADINYVLTRLTNPFTSTNNQNNFKYSAGVQYRWGGK
jgi:Outer membrane protein beta-barrel domain